MASICKHKYFKWQNSKILGCFPVLIYTVLAKKKQTKKNQTKTSKEPNCINTVLNFDSMNSH